MQGPPAYANGGFAPPPPGMQVVQQVVQPPPGHGPPPGLHIVQQMPPPPHHQQHNEPHHFQGQPPPGAVVTQVVHGPPPPPPPGFQNVPPPDFQKPHGHHQGPPPANGPPPRGSAPYPPASRQRGDPNYEPLDLPPPGWVPPTRQDNHQQGQGRAAEEPVRTGSVPPPGYEEQQPGGAEVSVASEDKVQQQSIDASVSRAPPLRVEICILLCLLSMVPALRGSGEGRAWEAERDAEYHPTLDDPHGHLHMVGNCFRSHTQNPNSRVWKCRIPMTLSFRVPKSLALLSGPSTPPTTARPTIRDPLPPPLR